VHITFPTLHSASRDLLARFSDWQSFITGQLLTSCKFIPLHLIMISSRLCLTDIKTQNISCSDVINDATTTTTTMSSSFQLELQRSSTLLCLACRHAFPPAVVLCPSLKCRWRCQSGIPFLCYPCLVPTAQGWKQPLLGAWHNDLPASAFLFVSWLKSLVGPHIAVHLWHVSSNWYSVLPQHSCVAAIKFLFLLLA